MISRYDEKGKIFTDVVSKQAVTVYIQTHTSRIYGQIYVRPQGRIKDELNQDERFLAVTDAVIMDHNGAVLFKSNFLTVHRDQIEWVIPETELIGEEEPAGGDA